MGALLERRKSTKERKQFRWAIHTNWTDFGDTGAGPRTLTLPQITVTANNIDDIS